MKLFSGLPLAGISFAALLAVASPSQAETISAKGCPSGPIYDFLSIGDPSMILRIDHDGSSGRNVTIHVVQGNAKPRLTGLSYDDVSVEVSEFGGLELLREVEMHRQIEAEVSTTFRDGKDELLSFTWSATSVDCSPRSNL